MYKSISSAGCNCRRYSWWKESKWYESTGTAKGAVVWRLDSNYILKIRCPFLVCKYSKQFSYWWPPQHMQSPRYFGVYIINLWGSFLPWGGKPRGRLQKQTCRGMQPDFEMYPDCWNDCRPSFDLIWFVFKPDYVFQGWVKRPEEISSISDAVLPDGYLALLEILVLL